MELLNPSTKPNMKFEKLGKKTFVQFSGLKKKMFDIDLKKKEKLKN